MILCFQPDRIPRILVFAKAPLPGRAKTRLIPALGPAGAAHLHANLVRRTLRTAARCRGTRVELHSAAPASHPLFASCGRNFELTRWAQCGGDLGRRMHRALRHTLRRAPCAILIGTDCPRLAVADLAQAIDSLQRGADAVLGPATDGGYWLIGLRRPAPFLFRAMPWGTSEVLRRTRQRLRHRGWTWHELPPRNDLDTPLDLARLATKSTMVARCLGSAPNNRRGHP